MTPRDPHSLPEWIGYFLFHDRATLSAAHVFGIAWSGFWIGRLVEQIRTIRKPKPPTQQGEPRA